MAALSPARHAYIHATADELLLRAGTERMDFAVLLRLCRDEGIELFDADLRDITGVLRPESNRWRIYLNRADAPARRLFTLAHLLAHFVLHTGRRRVFIESGFVRDQTVGEDESAEEREARAFAACLLMPSQAVAAALAGTEVNDRHVLDLAKRFSVSPLAMTLRMRGLGYRVTRSPPDAEHRITIHDPTRRRA